MFLKPMLIYPVGVTAACRYARRALEDMGLPTIDHPAPEITHVLLDVPSFAPDGSLRGGGSLEALLQMLPETLCVIGGNLRHPALEGRTVMDLLRDEEYLAANAALTADCALRVAAGELTTAFADASAVILGWGRIGKCLAKLLSALGTDVTVVARKEKDRAMIRALGYQAASVEDLNRLAPGKRLLFNTVPAPILGQEESAAWRECVKIDLASQRGLDGPDVIWSRGLPGVRTPVSSGALIARTILREVQL